MQAHPQEPVDESKKSLDAAREPINASRRNALMFASASLAAASLAPRHAAAQLADEANTAELEIIRKGIDRKLDIFNMDLLEQQARQVYGHGTYVFVANGSGKQWTLAENQRAWGDYAFEPQRMQGVVRDRIDLSIELLGQKLPHPFIITPFGSHGLHHPLAEVATAGGIAKSGGLLTVSSSSTASMDDIAKASSAPKWFQIYLTTDDGFSRTVLQRARDAGFTAIVLTVDAIGQGSSDEYLRLGRPRPWLPYGNFPDGNQPPFKTNLSWDDLAMIREATGLPVVVKGITRAEDARAAISAGAAAIQVSNHGGRALDGTPASITVLPEIAEAVKGEVPLILDSGIRRGTDIVKAMALGANAVAIGRPVMYGLALGGASGVDSVVEFFRRETVDTMLHLGVDRIAALDPKYIRKSAASGVHGPVRVGAERLG
ncbi:MAG TPA: alpha-hydroxy acid oxidase [Burkholderiaceae bacterium]|nr:alpha-hydroxy acid oxidase [Burkholderiaceae bacterium]